MKKKEADLDRQANLPSTAPPDKLPQRILY